MGNIPILISGLILTILGARVKGIPRTEFILDPDGRFSTSIPC